MFYRKNSKPPATPGKWPYGDRPAAPVRPTDAVDDQIAAFERRAEANRQLQAVASWLIVGFCAVALTVLVVLSMQRDETRRQECIDHGGTVQDVRNTQEWGAWICIPQETRP